MFNFNEIKKAIYFDWDMAKSFNRQSPDESYRHWTRVCDVISGMKTILIYAHIDDGAEMDYLRRKWSVAMKLANRSLL